MKNSEKYQLDGKISHRDFWSFIWSFMRCSYIFFCESLLSTLFATFRSKSRLEFCFADRKEEDQNFLQSCCFSEVFLYFY